MTIYTSTVHAVARLYIGLFPGTLIARLLFDVIDRLCCDFERAIDFVNAIIVVLAILINYVLIILLFAPIKYILNTNSREALQER